jgi:hypothetical protein
MNIIEAMKWVKKGYYIRRSWWKKDLLLAPTFYDFGQTLGCSGGSGWETFGLSVFNIEAIDWEVGPMWPKDITKNIRKKNGGLLYPDAKIAEWEKEQIRFIYWQETGEFLPKKDDESVAVK